MIWFKKKRIFTWTPSLSWTYCGGRFWIYFPPLRGIINAQFWQRLHQISIIFALWLRTVNIFSLLSIIWRHDKFMSQTPIVWNIQIRQQYWLDRFEHLHFWIDFSPLWRNVYWCKKSDLETKLLNIKINVETKVQ